MSRRKENKEAIKNAGIDMGILDSLSDLDTPVDKEKKTIQKGNENIEKVVKKETNKANKSEKIKKMVKRKNSEHKSKRSYMLTDKQVEMVYLLRAKYWDKDLSDIVGEAIEEYYKRNK